ncbi:hypothetical protein Tco_0907131 [Tanacetum coccineum]|uniref:Uncharacterized protein n=1 Tax=Tanacetum coccineum TaxID=301880 RepID=A0ABQ5CIE7_9ASTR
MVEEPVVEQVKPMKRLEQMRLDEELAFKLQAEEERLAREKAQQIEEANIAWDDVQAKIDADYQLAQRLQAQEQEELSDAEKATLFVQFLEKRRKHFAAKKSRRKEEQTTNKSSTKEYHVTELVEESSKKAKAEITQEGSSKRAGDELEQENAKKQKVDKDKETAELQSLIKIVPDEDGGLVLILYDDLKTMFELHVEDQIWKNLDNYSVLDWKLYDSCGVHSLTKQNVYIHMLVEKRYPLTPATITDMLNNKLQADHWNEKCYLLLKLIIKQLKNQ